MSSTTTGAGAFMETLADFLAPKLAMYLLQARDGMAVYAGLWSTWLLNGEAARAAKVLLVTVLAPAEQPPPARPLDLEALVPWVVLQCKHLTENSPAWDPVVVRALAPEMQRQAAPDAPTRRAAPPPAPSSSSRPRRTTTPRAPWRSPAPWWR